MYRKRYTIYLNLVFFVLRKTPLSTKRDVPVCLSKTKKKKITLLFEYRNL